MKKIVFLRLRMAGLSQAEQVRVSYMLVHYSVGQSAINNCQGSNGNIRNVLDTMTVAVGADTARIVLRTYNINYDHQDSALSDTAYIWSGGDWCNVENRINTGFDYNFQGGGVSNRNRIFDTDWYSPLLRNIFQRPSKEDSIFWYPFVEHQIPYDNGDMVTEHYDMVIFKNPYIVWRDFSTAKADSIKKWYRAVRDSVVNHPDINVTFFMGTPLAYQTGSDDDFDSDTTLAKMVYELATWFAGDDFVVHSNDPEAQYRNVWTYDIYRPMAETGSSAYNRYCLRDSYWAGSGAQSHLSSAGMVALQNVFIDYFRQATEDLLIQKAGGVFVTRRDIDRKILEFREGQATLPEVQELIEQYNTGGE